MKIRWAKTKAGTWYWQLDCGLVNGRRERLSFETKDDAEAEMARRKDVLRIHGEKAFSLTEAERLRFVEARDRLATVGGTIERAVDHYLATRPRLKGAITLEKALDAAVLEKAGLRRKDRYLRQFKVSCGSFVKGREERDMASITRDEVKAWVLGNGWAAKTQANYLGDLAALFAWAKREGYTTFNPCCDGEAIPLALADEKEVGILSVEACKSLLLTALQFRGKMKDHKTQRWKQGPRYLDLLGYVALGIFSGVRPEELARGSRADLDLAGGTLFVRGIHAKTRTQRVVALFPVALGWLRAWHKACPGDWIVPRGFRGRWESLRTDAGIKQWPHDALRHTAASMHYSMFQNETALKAMLGHSQHEDTLFQSYRAVRFPNGKPLTKADADAFYQLECPD